MINSEKDIVSILGKSYVPKAPEEKIPPPDVSDSEVILQVNLYILTFHNKYQIFDADQNKVLHLSIFQYGFYFITRSVKWL